MESLRLVVLAPGHFHAALIQKQMLPGVDPHVHVYAPLDGDLLAYLERIAAFNRRPVEPTVWTLSVDAGTDWRERFLNDSPGNVVVISGRNRRKIDLIEMAVKAGKHVLADKPWIIEPDDLPRLRHVLDLAWHRNSLVYDVMTERFEITSILQKDLVNDSEIFGQLELGSPAEPAVAIESVHHIKKRVAGVPLRRPGWFFDIREQGEALADVGTHLVDLVQWTIGGNDVLRPERDIEILHAQRWPTLVRRDDFHDITGLDDFPANLRPMLDGDKFPYFGNTRVVYRLRRTHVRLDVLWRWESPGGDTHNALYRGTTSDIAVRQTSDGQPELFVLPRRDSAVAVRSRVEAKVAKWQPRYPGVRVVDEANGLRIDIPAVHRHGHEAHFASVAADFLRFVRSPDELPEWELPNLVAKYATTTKGVARSRTVEIRPERLVT